MESQNGAVVGYYGIRFVLPTGKAENNSSTGFTAACAAFFLSYPILSLSTIAIVSFCVGYYGFNYFWPEKEVQSNCLNNIVASGKSIASWIIRNFNSSAREPMLLLLKSLTIPVLEYY